jgi:Fe-S cluster biogenesis protein NfuA
MEPIKVVKVTLCPACSGCPTVEITDEGVRIGEKENKVRLTHAEWNDLVARIRRGELAEVNR